MGSAYCNTEMFSPESIENKLPVDQLRQMPMIEYAESIKSRGMDVTKVEELSDTELNIVSGGDISGSFPVRYEWDMQTGRLVGYDSDGNVISDDPTTIN